MCICCEEIKMWKNKFGSNFNYGCQLYATKKDSKVSVTSWPFNLKYCPVCGQQVAEESYGCWKHSYTC